MILFWVNRGCKIDLDMNWIRKTNDMNIYYANDSTIPIAIAIVMRRILIEVDNDDKQKWKSIIYLQILIGNITFGADVLLFDGMELLKEPMRRLIFHDGKQFNLIIIDIQMNNEVYSIQNTFPQFSIGFTRATMTINIVLSIAISFCV